MRGTKCNLQAVGVGVDSGVEDDDDGAAAVGLGPPRRQLGPPSLPLGEQRPRGERPRLFRVETHLGIANHPPSK